MSLKIFLLGQFKLQANNLPIELPSRPAQSLLAYLALNAGVTHRREKLASLLWPDTIETNARSYLRQALWRIRKTLESGDLNWQDILQISDISVAFDNQSNYWLDTEQLLKSVAPQSLDKIVEIVQYYRGELLPGFYDEWVLPERDRLEAAYHQKMNQLLDGLIQSGKWHEALKWGEDWIRLGHSPEPAFRALMMAYTGLGDQSMVSATYKRCGDSLDRELGLDPSTETRQLFEQILQGNFDGFVSPPVPPTEPAAQQPAFFDEVGQHPIEMPLFVAREDELAQLNQFLGLTLISQGQVVFVTGEAGSGKTSLVNEFTRRAQEIHTDLIVAIGNCNAYTGIGDPYLPFREVLELLTGDVEARWAAGAVGQEHARRLWNIMPVSVQALVEVGSGLIDTFIAGAPLVDRVRGQISGKADWLYRLDELTKQKTRGVATPGSRQSDLFEQYTRVLQILSHQAPLMLVLDDLQWADLGSISLLFHLGRQLAGSRILIVGAFRPEEIAFGRDGERHPLEPVVNEFKRNFGDNTVDLGLTESRDFIDAILDSEPNLLGLPFREMLYAQTRGHPLFIIELLRGLQDRGDLIRDRDGNWVAGQTLNWEALPARVEAVIAERIGRLEKPLQAILRVASVEGEVFTAEVITQVQSANERKIVEQLSGELDRRHRLVRSQAIERLGPHRISRYRFRNYLFQKYLYDNLDEVERSYLHEDVGNVLEELYGNQANEIAVQLAWHFQEAGITTKAIHYLHQAGERALRVSAYQEGLAHLSRGLALLEMIQDSPERAQQELSLRLALGIALQGKLGPQTDEYEGSLIRAQELCQQLGKTTQLCQVKGSLAVLYYVRAEYQKALRLAEETLELASQTDNQVLEALGQWCIGFISLSLGDNQKAKNQLEKVVNFYKPHYHTYSVFLRGSDFGVGALSYYACCLWCLGYPDQALERSMEALKLARKLDHPFSIADALSFAGCMLNSMRRDGEAFKQNAVELIQLTQDGRLLGWLGSGTRFLGESLVMMGQYQEGISKIQDGLSIMKLDSVSVHSSHTLGFLAQAQAKTGQIEDGLNTLREALELVEQRDERLWESELHRMRGEILLMQNNQAESESSLHKAIDIARQQNAKSWELRASVELARLWHKQGRTSDALQMLEKIYGWFTEGFDTPDVRAAKALIEELGLQIHTKT
jgi:predicted ATPase/DNA-binding SARP family transcriptional activator